MLCAFLRTQPKKRKQKMPNHVQNRLKVTGGDTDKLMNAITGESSSRIDFNKIIPMPKDLQIESSSIGEIGMMILYGKSTKTWLQDKEKVQKRFDELRPADQAIAKVLGKKYHDNIEKYGHADWYSWCIDNWGTKWNAYDTPTEEDTEDTIFFQTAWSNVLKIIEKLHTIFPDTELFYDWADEDTGSNTGRAIITQNGTLYTNLPTNQSRQAYELYFELHGGDDSWELIDGKYEYIEE